MSEKFENGGTMDFLSSHLNVVESIKNHILQEFYDEQTEERDKFESLINQYILNIKNIANIKTGKKEGMLSQWPLVLIGSVVEVEDLEYNETETLKIVPPFYGDKAGKLECASCLSPVGNALLLKSIGDKITVKTPLGDSNLKVKSIELPSA